MPEISLDPDKPQEGEYEWEADEAVDEFAKIIDSQETFIRAEHRIIDQIKAWHYVLAHLDEKIPEDRVDLLRITSRIAAGLLDIQAVVESAEKKEIHIIQEEDKILRQLTEDTQMRDWVAVSGKADEEIKTDEKMLRVEIHQLNILYSKFKNLLAILESAMKKSNIKVPIKLLEIKPKKDYESDVNYYLLHIHNFVKAYSRVLAKLVRKEKSLLKIAKARQKKLK